MNTITMKHLEGMINRLNRITNSPEEYMTDGKINIGYYHLDGAYGGYMLVRTMNEGGGINCPIGQGHVTKRDLYNRLSAFISGIESTRSV